MSYEVGCVPEVHYVVLVVPPVQVHVVWVQKHEGEEDDDDLHRFLPSVHKVSVEHIRVIG